MMLKPIHVIIPMAGDGKRFSNAGYKEPKPFINVSGTKMVVRVIDNISGVFFYFTKNNTITFVCRSNINKVFKDSLDSCRIEAPTYKNCVYVEEKTEGAACTVLYGIQNSNKQIDTSDHHLIICNSDQIMDWSPSHFIKWCERTDCDGAIPVFYNTNPKWSFAKTEDDGITVSEVAEKKQISTWATTGLYYFKSEKDYIWAANKMIEKDIRHNGEFYVAPVYNQLIQAGKKILIYPVAGFYGMGTPEDLLDTMEAIAKGLIGKYI